MQIIPAIDMYQNRCVRLTKGVFAQQVEYDPDPFDMAKIFYAAKIRHLHLVDLEGAELGVMVHWKWLEKVRTLKNLFMQAGGGIRSEADVERLLAIGIDSIIVGSIAIKEPGRFAAWVRNYGAQHFCVALDVNNGSLVTHGWQQQSSIGMDEAVSRFLNLGVRRALATDVDRDGTLTGPNFDLYRDLVIKHPQMQWLASGGVGSMQDIKALEDAGVAGVIVGKALYERKIRLEELTEALC